MIRRGAWILAFAATASIAADFARAQNQPAPAKSQELYQSVYSGWKWWHVYCYRCHGTNAVGTTLAPNLTDPNEKMSLLSFKTVVKTGSADGQMQAWDGRGPQERPTVRTSGSEAAPQLVDAAGA